MPDNPRIEELRRRVQKDPASIAFAQLAEEYRRAGQYQEAAETCRGGLTVHPGYLSARVTLGRALIELNDLDAAETELKYVLNHAPENLAAVRGLAEVHHRRGNLGEALSFYQSALALAKHDPDLEQAIEEISRTIAPERAPITDGLTFEQAAAEFLSALDAITQRSGTDGAPGATGASGPSDARAAPAATGGSAEADAGSQVPAKASENPALAPLERFLDAIRKRRAV